MRKENDCLYNEIRKYTSIFRPAVFASVVLMSVFLFGCGKGESSDKADLSIGEKNHYELALEAISNQDADAAKGYLDAAKGEAEDKLLYRAEGMIYLQKSDYNAAKECFLKALSESNGIIKDIDIDISYYLAVAQYKKGDYKDAIDTYNAILGLEEKEADAYYLRGKAYLASGDKDKAIQDYDKAIELDASNYNHYMRICEDLRGAGYVNDGDAYITRAMDNTSKLSSYQRGVFEYYLGQYTDARNDLEAAREDKNDADLILYLGRTYEALNDASYAISLYESAISDDPNNGMLYEQLGVAKIGMGDYEGALNAFETGLNTGDQISQQGLLYNRIIANEYLLKFDDAKQQMAEYLEKYPQDQEALRENEFLVTR